MEPLFLKSVGSVASKANATLLMFINQILMISLKCFPCFASPLQDRLPGKLIKTSEIVIAATVTMTTVSLDGITAERQIRRVFENIHWKINVEYLEPWRQ